MYHPTIRLKYPLKKTQPRPVDIGNTINQLYDISRIKEELIQTKNIFVQKVEEAEILIAKAEKKIESLQQVAKGDRGPQGIPGKEGKTIIGPKGEQGEPGMDGQTIVGPMGAKGDIGKNGSPDKPLEIADKLNTTEQSIERKVIKGLDEELSILSQRIRREMVLGGGMVRGGGSPNFVSPVSGAVNGVNTTFVFKDPIKALIVDGVMKFESVGYTLSGLTVTITDGAPPVLNIRAIL